MVRFGNTLQEGVSMLNEFGNQLIITPAIIKRFMSKVYKFRTDGCWEWCAATNNGGYGEFGINGKIYKAHRISYLIHYGDLDNTDDVLHSCDFPRCDFPRCVNPNHLFLGNQLINMQDCARKGRIVTPRGENNGLSKLTDKDVLEIIELSNKGYNTYRLGEMFGVNATAIQKILTGKTWRHITGR